MMPYFDYKGFLIPDTAGIIANYLPMKTIVKIRLVSKNWKNSFSINYIWKRFLERDYPYVYKRGMDDCQKIYFYIKNSTYNCLANKTKTTVIKKLALSRNYRPLVDLNSFFWANSLSYSVCTRGGINIFSTNPLTLYKVRSHHKNLIPRIHQDKYLLLRSKIDRTFKEVWDLTTKEKIFDIDNPSQPYFFDPETDTFQLLPSSKIPAVINFLDYEPSKRVICRDDQYTIVSCDGTPLLDIGSKRERSLEGLIFLPIIETKYLYILDPIGVSNFYIVHKDTGKLEIFSKTFGSCVTLINNTIISTHRNNIYITKLNKFINNVAPIQRHFYDMVFGKMIYVYANKIIFDLEDLYNFYNPQNKECVPVYWDHKCPMNKRVWFEKGFLFFIGYSPENNNLLLVVDFDTGAEIKKFYFKGRFIGITNDYKLIFRDIKSKIYIRFKTIDLLNIEKS